MKRNKRDVQDQRKTHLAVVDDHALFRAAISGDQSRISESGLSSREMEVLNCLAQGRTTVQIANELFISENTVKTHVRHILEKLEASNRAEAVSKAIQMGLIGDS